jgi:hypothetical protein
MTLTPEFVHAAVVTTGAGFAMMIMGLAHGLLKARAESRRCESCGRWIEARYCPYCSRS